MSDKVDRDVSDDVQGVGLVPRLRFPEFAGAASWRGASLGELAVFHKGVGLPKSEVRAAGATPCIHYGELFRRYGEVAHTVLSYTDAVEGAVVSSVDDVLMPTSDVTPNGLAKACCLKVGGVILGGDILIIRLNLESLSGEFVSRQIRHLETRVLQLVSGTTVFHLYSSSLAKLKIAFPDIREQQRIADCLSSLDDLIVAETRKLDALKTHKKGLMQQLFPREGETVPRLRFSEFREGGGWRPSKLEDLLRFMVNGLDLKQTKARSEGSIAVTRIETISDGTIDLSRVGFVETMLDVSQYQLEYGDILVSHINSWSQIGKSVIYTLQVPLYHGMNLLRLAVDSRIALPWFVYYCLNTPSVQDAIRAHANPAVNQVSINQTALGSIEIPVPHEYEQQRIADCLSSLDDLIVAETRKLDALKTHKKGLMQQLFPLPEASIT